MSIHDKYLNGKDKLGTPGRSAAPRFYFSRGAIRNENFALRPSALARGPRARTPGVRPGLGSYPAAASGTGTPAVDVSATVTNSGEKGRQCT